MAVETLYISSRDGLEMALQNPDTMIFTSKADADARDKLLELSEEVREFLLARVEGIEDAMAEKVSMVIAEHKDLFAKGLKKPSVLNESAENSE